MRLCLITFNRSGFIVSITVSLFLHLNIKHLHVEHLSSNYEALDRVVRDDIQSHNYRKRMGKSMFCRSERTKDVVQTRTNVFICWAK